VLNAKMLNDMPPDCVFATGVTTDSPTGANINGTGRKMCWIAKRGTINDWAIYVMFVDELVTTISSLEQFDFTRQVPEEYYNHPLVVATLMSIGHKLVSLTNVARLVPCEIDALELYRR